MSAPDAPAGTSVQDRLLLGIVAGVAPDKVARHLGVPEREIESVIAEAKRRLTVAADYNRIEQLGTSISRLNDCYSRALNAKDIKTAVAVQKELNRLMDLYRPSSRSSEPDGAASAVELVAVRSHLAPLKLSPDTASTEEMARMAVAEIVRLRHAE